jgi:hypothetical protein
MYLIWYIYLFEEGLLFTPKMGYGEKRPFLSFVFKEFGVSL